MSSPLFLNPNQPAIALVFLLVNYPYLKGLELGAIALSHLLNSKKLTK